VRSDRVVVLEPLLDEDGGLLQAVEDLTVQAFVAQFAVEALAVAVLPRTAGLDVKRGCSKPCEPAAHDLRRHLRAIVGPDVFRHAALKHHIRHRLDDAKAIDATRHPDRKAFPGKLIDQRHEPELTAIMSLGLDEVVAPDMIAMLRS
jgi:hypothetical protein